MMRNLFLFFSVFGLMALVAFGQKTVSKPRKFPIGKVGQIRSEGAKVAELIEVVSPKLPELKDSPLTILAKPRPISRFDHGCMQGVIRLRVTFLETEEIGKISPISGLTESSTQEAIEAAAKIKFLPAILLRMENG